MSDRQMFRRPFDKPHIPSSTEIGIEGSRDLGVRCEFKAPFDEIGTMKMRGITNDRTRNTRTIATYRIANRRIFRRIRDQHNRCPRDTIGRGSTDSHRRVFSAFFVEFPPMFGPC